MKHAENNDDLSKKEDGFLISKTKLMEVADSLRPWMMKQKLLLQLLPCRAYEDTINYRCRCSFQVVSFYEDCDACQRFQYAVRQKGEPIRINDFPTASYRIQNAMVQLLEYFNNTSFAAEYLDHSNNPPRRGSILTDNLSSVTFSSSWAGINCNKEHEVGLNKKDCNEDHRSDCVVTLNYDVHISCPELWRDAAKKACMYIGLNQMSGRSRKYLLRAFNDNVDPFLRDTVWLHCYKNLTSKETSWEVRIQDSLEAMNERCSDVKGSIPVLYEKPEGAFFHPNANVMCLALAWMLNCISKIVFDPTGGVSPPSPATNGKINLLELYCGCGAHTVAIARANLVANIVSIENDERLVEACRRNCILNGITLRECKPKQHNVANEIESHFGAGTNENTTTIEIVSVDAGKWALENSNNNSTICADDGNIQFDILLVDPPRQGLTKEVCDMAINHDFQHILYISCGKDALVRDLDCLSTHYEVIDCVLLDLFPGTLSVESLVHLGRKKVTS